MEILIALFSTMSWVISKIHTVDVALSLLGLFIFLSVYRKVMSKGGPMIWPVVGFIPNVLLHYNHLHEWNTTILSNCGGTYRFSGRLTGQFCNWIVTADPVKVEYMLRTRFTNFPKGKFYRERFRELLGDGIFNADGDRWKLQRRVATSEMHTARFMEYSLKTMQWLVHHKLLNLVEKHAAAGSGYSGASIVDLQQWLLRFTFDNVCMVAMGVDPGCLDPDLSDIPFARAFEEATEYSLFRFLMLPLVWKGMRALKLGTERKLQEAVKIVHEFADNVVTKRRVELGSESSFNQKDDLLSRLMMIESRHGQQTNNEIRDQVNYFSDKFLRDFCVSFILAGRDTSSVALAWFFWLIHENPLVQDKIVEEIHEILGKTRSTEELSSEELNKLVYLEAALSETLRLYPPVPVDFKEVVEDDVYPDGTWVRSGDRVFYHTYAMGRMESIWGKDAAEFKPERWIKEDTHLGHYHIISPSPFKYVVFNAGPRLCVGKKFAYTQMKMVAASILLRFQVKVVENQVIAPKITTTLYMKNGLLVTFQPRLNSYQRPMI